jgi:tetratricopeptide (TPR) repeat protein
VSELQAATRLDRNYRTGWSHLARALDAAGKPDDALAALQEALKLDDRFLDDHLFLAVVLRTQNRVDDALAVLARVQQTRGQDPQVIAAVNAAWQDKSRQSQSIPELRQAVARNPKDADALLKLAKLETAAADVKNAMTHFGMAVAARPEDPAVHAEAGRANLTFGNYRAAVAALKRANGLTKGENPAIALDFGRAQMEAGLLDQAVETLTKVTAARPGDPWAYHYLSVAHERRGDYPAALAAHKRAADRRRNALNFNPRHPDAVTALAHKAALTEKGEAVLRGQAKLDPADRVPFAHLCFVQKKYASAARFFAEAFADQPALADDREAAHRRTASAAAVRAGLGHGPEGKDLPEAERARHRRRAYDWLAGELAGLEKQMAKAPEAEFFAIQDYLRGWGGDVFDDREFDFGALPAGEREQWQRLWERADDLASRAKTPN